MAAQPAACIAFPACLAPAAVGGWSNLQLVTWKPKIDCLLSANRAMAPTNIMNCPAGEICSAAATLGMLRFFLLSHQEDFDVVWCRGVQGWWDETSGCVGQIVPAVQAQATFYMRAYNPSPQTPMLTEPHTGAPVPHAARCWA